MNPINLSSELDTYFESVLGSVPRTLKSSHNSDKIDGCLERKDYETIIRDKDLFWLAYCIAMSLHQDKNKDDFFYISKEGNNIELSGKEHIMRDIRDTIEELRKWFLQDLESKKSFEILFTTNRLQTDVYFRKASSLPEGRHKSFFYLEYVKPALPKLAEFCGALYSSEDRKGQPIQLHGEPNTFGLESVRINWEQHLVYPISPKVIPDQEELNKAFYSLYQNQQLCDLSLVSENEAIKVHSNLLYIYGGPVMQRLLTSQMKEVEDKSISFPEYSKSTVQAFVEFIYLGGKGFSELIISPNYPNKIDLFELFKFANVYQIQTLIDCCTNLISLIATKEDLQGLQHLATLYDNEHLKKLCEYFSIKDSTTTIKV